MNDDQFDLKYMPGDIVELKSGSPRMTVQHTTGNVSVNCVWFAPSDPGKLYEYDFYKDALIHSSMTEQS